MNIITLGTFDIFHYGHMNLLKKCREFAGDGDVIVGLNTDAFVEKYKGKPPVMNYAERSEAIYSFDENIIILPNSQEPDGSIKELINNYPEIIHLIVIGSDWAIKDYVGQLGIDWDWLNDHGIGICYLNYTHGISTTEIKKRLQK